ncbi:MAG TPA: hypothetical protein VEH29_09105 [Acidimicrobiales bacterium]|nr:hypothetical protein [Acidimicrobiales bacterium]
MAAQPVPRSRTPGPSLRLSIPLLVLGIVGAIVSFTALGRALLHSISNAPVMTSPGSEQVSCRPGTYVLYVESGTTSLAATAASVTVTGPSGQSVPVQLEPAAETISRSGVRFSGDVGFVVTTAGSYAVTVHTAGADVVVAPSFTTTARENIGWVFGLLASLLIGLVGFVLLVMGLVQRSRAKKQLSGYGGGAWGGPPGPGWPAPAPPPGGGWQGQPGWSPPPAQPGWPPPQWPPPQGPPAEQGWPPPQGPPAEQAWPGAGDASRFGSFPSPGFPAPAVSPLGADPGAVSPLRSPEGTPAPSGEDGGGWPRPSSKPTNPSS